jgi:2-hydroxy-6-oxonona-2,4-dienedioate hydrolase
MDATRYREAEGRLWTAAGARPTERTLRLPTLGVEVRLQAVGDGDPVLFLHGGPNAGSTWAAVAAELGGFRRLLLDRPGTGLSDPLRIGPDNLAAVADVLVADVLDALELPDAHVVASSFGGFLALRSAAATPQRFGRMVQMACPAGAPGMRMPAFMKALVTPGLGRLIDLFPPTERAGRMILRQIGHGPSLDAGRIPQEFLDWYLAMQRHTDTMANESRMIRSLASRRAGWHPALTLPDELLARVTTPTFFLWGADDPFGGEEVASRLVAAMPDAHLELVPAAGHLPWLDDPERAARRVAAFLRHPVAVEEAHAW